MLDKISAYDQRQYKLMLAKLLLYKKDKISLKNLIFSLESLLKVLNIMDENWKNEFVRNWGVLEVVYACFVYPKYEELNEKDKKYVNEGKDKIEIKDAVNKLIKLVEPKIVEEDET